MEGKGALAFCLFLNNCDELREKCIFQPQPNPTTLPPPNYAARGNALETGTHAIVDKDSQIV